MNHKSAKYCLPFLGGTWFLFPSFASTLSCTCRSEAKSSLTKRISFWSTDDIPFFFRSLLTDYCAPASSSATTRHIFMRARK